MMRISLILMALILLVACGQVPNQSSGGEQIGQEIVQYSPQIVVGEDSDRINDICRAIAAKTDQLVILENTQYTFSYAEKSCASGSMSAYSDVRVAIEKPNSNYIFKIIGANSPFIFSNIETKDAGLMKEICDNAQSLTSPMQSGSSGVIWFTSLTRATDCVSSSTHLCMQIERGSLVAGTSYKKNTKEIIKFKISGENQGFFTERKQITTLSCPEGAQLVRHAILK